MTTVQTIQLDDSERLALQRTLGIIDRVSELARVSKENVFKYFWNVADIKGDYVFCIKSLHNIEEIRGE